MKRPKRPKKRATKRASKTHAQVSHPFHYRLELPDGTFKILAKMARVKLGTTAIELVLTADHVRKSIELNGAGNTGKCSVAVCSRDHAEAFPHEVNGHIDMQNARIFVATHHDKQGLPDACVVYEHNAGVVAKLNDSASGQKKLLEMIERDGPITITLKPYRRRSKPGRPGKGRLPSGARGKKPRGDRLRYQVMQMAPLAVPEELARGRRGNLVRRKKKAA